MKNAISYLSIAVFWAAVVVFTPQSTAAQAATPVEKAEQELQKAIDELQAEVNRIREKVKQNPKYHETFEELSNKRKAVKKAAEKLLDETKKQREQAQKKIEREKNEAKKRQAESDKAKADKIRDALDDWAKKAQELADANDNEKGDYDKAKEALDAAKKALDKARAIRDATKALQDAEEALENERGKKRPNPTKIAEQEKARKAAKAALDELLKPEAVRSMIPAESRHHSQTTRQTYFVVSLTGSVPFGDLNPQTVGLPELQGVLFAPSLFPQLMERLGGEFYPGSITGETAVNYTLEGRASFSPGLRIGLGIGERFEIRAQGQRFQNEWSGRFPVTVFPFEGSAPYTLQGSLNGSTQGFIAESDLTFFLSTGTVQPYLKAGGRGFFHTENRRWAAVGGMDLPLEAPATTSTYSAFGGGGVRIGFLSNGFVELGATYGKVPGAGYLPALDFAAGWRFGGNKALKSLPVNVNANQDLHKKQCNCEHLTAKILIQNLTRLENIQKEIEDKKTLLASKRLDEVQKNEAQAGLAELEKMLSSKVYEEERNVAQDGALPAAIVSRIAEAGDQVKLKIKALDLSSKVCHCTNPENNEPDCIFKLVLISKEGNQLTKFTRVEEGALKYTTVWYSEYVVSNENPKIEFRVAGHCEKPGSLCDPSTLNSRVFEISFRKADVHDK